MDTLKNFLDSPEVSKVVKDTEQKIKDLDANDYVKQLSDDAL